MYLVDPNRINYNINDTNINHLEYFEYNSLTFNNLIVYSSIFGFFCILRFLFYLAFSAKLTLVLDVISNAIIDIFLFLIMFIIILSAFSIVGIIIFGYKNYYLQNFFKAFLS